MAQTNVNRRYNGLRLAAWVLKMLGVLLGVLALIALVAGIVGLVILLLSDPDAEATILVATTGLVLVLPLAFYALLLYAGGQFIELMLELVRIQRRAARLAAASVTDRRQLVAARRAAARVVPTRQARDESYAPPRAAAPPPATAEPFMAAEAAEAARDDGAAYAPPPFMVEEAPPAAEASASGGGNATRTLAEIAGEKARLRDELARIQAAFDRDEIDEEMVRAERGRIEAEAAQLMRDEKAIRRGAALAPAAPAVVGADGEFEEADWPD
jgi:hypothetical protein